jgi:hypothetical protein
VHRPLVMELASPRTRAGLWEEGMDALPQSTGPRVAATATTANGAASILI